MGSIETLSCLCAEGAVGSIETLVSLRRGCCGSIELSRVSVQRVLWEY